MPSLFDPFRPFGVLGSQSAGAGWGLVPRQERLYVYRAALWRPRFAYSGAGKETRTWFLVAENVPLYLESSPSQFELQGEVLLSEGDNVFTLDKLHFPASVDIGPDDVLQITTGPAAILNGWWKLRGDIQPHVYRAGKVVLIAGRIAEPPAGIPN